MNRNISTIFTDLKAKFGTDVGTSGMASGSTITVPSMNVPDNAYIGRSITIDGTSAGSYTVTANTDTTLTVAETLTNEAITVTINGNSTIETDCDTGIAKMAAGNPNLFTQYNYPTYNSCFVDYEGFCTILIQMRDSWQNKDVIDIYMTTWNLFMDIDPLVLNTDANVINYIAGILAMADDTDTIQNDIQSYLVRLNILMGKLIISDTRIAGDEWQGLYGTKEAATQTDIDTYYQYYLDNDSNMYAEYKISLMYDIKIT